MRIVRRHDAKPEVLTQPEHPFSHDVFFGDAVLLDFEPEAVLPEELGKPGRAAARLLVIALSQPERDLARQAGCQADDALMVLGEDLLVDARTPVKPLGVTD
jgi:hypothetical protein